MSRLDFIKGATTNEGAISPHKVDFYRHDPRHPSVPSPEKQEAEVKKLEEEVRHAQAQVDQEKKELAEMQEAPVKKRRSRTQKVETA